MDLSLPLILASNSPQRKRLLKNACIPFIVRPSEIEEKILPSWSPKEAALQLAYQKAAAVKDSLEDKEREKFYGILAADTIVVLENQILGKPRDKEDAYQMVWNLSRKKHQVITGVCFWAQNSSQPLLEADISYITMLPMSKQDIQNYINSGVALDKAGAIDIEYILDRYVQKIEGSLDNVIGLPVDLVKKMMASQIGQSTFF